MATQKAVRGVALFVLLFVFVAASDAYGVRESVFIYYQNGPDLLRINLLQNSTSVVASDFPGPIEFSPDNGMMAFIDNAEVWVGDFELLDFREIVTDARGLPTYGGLFWTPDSRFLIFNHANRTRQGELPDQVISYIYDRTADQVAEWDWGNCSSLVRSRATHRVALKCVPIASSNPIITTSIVLPWGGEPQDFVDDEYEILLEHIEFPGNFDWSMSAQTEQVVYIDAANSFDYDVYIYESGEETRMLGLAAEYDIQYNILSVSPDRTMVAYIVECNYYGLRSCLQISDLNTGSIIWDYENTASLAFVFELQWSPDNRYVVMLGMDSSLDYVISVFDFIDGTSQDFFVKYADGNLAVTLE